MTGQANVVYSMMRLVQLLMHEACEHEDAAENRHMRTWLSASFLFSIPWTIAGITDPEGRTKFDQFYKDLLFGKLEEHPIPKSIGKVEPMFPERDMVYDFVYEVRGVVSVKSQRFHQSC